MTFTTASEFHVYFPWVYACLDSVLNVEKQESRSENFADGSFAALVKYIGLLLP